MDMGGGVFIIINAVNLVNVRLYGETEFWFALIKVLAIIGMIGFGLWLLFSGHGGEHASIDNLWRYNGFFATGWQGLILSLAVIMFSFGGLELIGITAAEARDPQKVFRKRSIRWSTVFCCSTSVRWWFCWHSIRG